MIEPMYLCPNCKAKSFVASARHPDGYLVGACIACEKSACVCENCAAGYPMSANLPTLHDKGGAVAVFVKHWEPKPVTFTVPVIGVLDAQARPAEMYAAWRDGRKGGG